jgi:hypothetical protein
MICQNISRVRIIIKPISIASKWYWRFFVNYSKDNKFILFSDWNIFNFLQVNFHSWLFALNEGTKKMSQNEMTNKRKRQLFHSKQKKEMYWFSWFYQNFNNEENISINYKIVKKKNRNMKREFCLKGSKIRMTYHKANNFWLSAKFFQYHLMSFSLLNTSA